MGDDDDDFFYCDAFNGLKLFKWLIKIYVLKIHNLEFYGFFNFVVNFFLNLSSSFKIILKII